MKQAEKTTRSPRRILTIVIATLALIVLYAYTIDVTKINFEEPQDKNRQQAVTRVVRSLARPDFFERSEEKRAMNITIHIPCVQEKRESEFSLSDGRTAAISPNCASTTQDTIVVNGTGFRPRTNGIIRWHPPGDVQTTRALAAFRTDADGAFQANFTMPDIRPSDAPQRIEIEEKWPSGGFLGTGIIGLSEASEITIDKIIETVLLALMATTVGTLLAIPISFLAARNLMANVGLPLAAVMTAVILLALGYFLGNLVTRQLLNLAAAPTSSTLINTGLAIVSFIFAAVLMKIGSSALSSEEFNRTRMLTEWIRVMIAMTIVFFAIALLAHMGIEFGNRVTPQLGGLAFLGRFISFLSESVTVLSPFVVGFSLGLVGASVGATYGQEAILRVPEVPGRVITGVTAMLATAILIYGIGSLCNWLWQFDNPAYWTLYPAIVGGVIMLVIGLGNQPKRPFPIGFVLYTIFRFVLNVIRSIEPLIYVIVFVVWVSVGPFAGVLALTIHTIAALGKLYSEQVESIAEGPVEAITATGASSLQTVVYAVIPQIVPPFIAFTLYRWDINVRFSTILGFAGGGGIGFVLVQAINLFQYRQAAVMMIAIAIVVWVLDYASSEIRNRVI